MESVWINSEPVDVDDVSNTVNVLACVQFTIGRKRTELHSIIHL